MRLLTCGLLRSPSRLGFGFSVGVGVWARLVLRGRGGRGKRGFSTFLLYVLAGPVQAGPVQDGPVQAGPVQAGLKSIFYSFRLYKRRNVSGMGVS